MRKIHFPTLVCTAITFLAVLIFCSIFAACVSLTPTGNSEIRSTIVRNDTITTRGNIQVTRQYKDILK